jgi:hypothetical protein
MEATLLGSETSAQIALQFKGEQLKVSDLVAIIPRNADALEIIIVSHVRMFPSMIARDADVTIWRGIGTVPLPNDEAGRADTV